MFTLKGKFAEANVYADIIEDEAISQIMNMLSQQFTKDSHVAIMPDVHAGKGCTIGTTLTIKDKIVPNLVGVDIGCGVTAFKINENLTNSDFEKLDRVIRENIPSGFDVRSSQTESKKLFNTLSPAVLDCLHCAKNINLDRAYVSMGTLGGGNHYIELDSDGNDSYICVHSGSRNLGTRVATYYQNLAIAMCGFDKEKYDKKIIEIRRKFANNKAAIHGEISKLRETYNNVPNDLRWLECKSFSNYLDDMKIIQMYASDNRHAMLRIICKEMSWKPEDEINTIHNYIDIDKMILRKGAVSADKGQILLIPANMRDGMLICEGKGNPDWNYSAPHGAGRLKSRSAAKRDISLEDFKESMKGIFTTSVGFATLDESPQAYKPIETLYDNISPTVDILSNPKPLYNFKASEENVDWKQYKNKKEAAV